jgi:hypothetical protein
MHANKPFAYIALGNEVQAGKSKNGSTWVSTGQGEADIIKGVNKDVGVRHDRAAFACNTIYRHEGQTVHKVPLRIKGTTS